MAHLHLNELSLICDMWLNKITYLLTYLLRIENLPWVPETFHARAFRFRPKLFIEISEGRDARI